jgi:hypothetical protein
MKLTAYSTAKIVDGVWDAWENVELWMLDGPKLILRVREDGRSVLKTVQLPSHVIGLADDAPRREMSTTVEQAQRNRAEREFRQESRESGPPRVPDRPTTARFGDSPRRRQFRGDRS